MKNWEFFYFGGCYMHECPRSACCRFQCRIFSYLQWMNSRFNKVKGQFYLNLRPFGFNLWKHFLFWGFIARLHVRKAQFTIYYSLYLIILPSNKHDFDSRSHSSSPDRILRCTGDIETCQCNNREAFWPRECREYYVSKLEFWQFCQTSREQNEAAWKFDNMRKKKKKKKCSLLRYPQITDV